MTTFIRYSAKLKMWQNVAVDTTSSRLFKVVLSLYISQIKLQEWLLFVRVVVDCNIITCICTVYTSRPIV